MGLEGENWVRQHLLDSCTKIIDASLMTEAIPSQTLSDKASLNKSNDAGLHVT